MTEYAPKPVPDNRSAIYDLAAHLLQDYVAMVVEQFHPEKSWSDIVAEILNEELSKSNPRQAYKDMKLKMDILGPDKYTPRSLDVTAATALILYHGEDLGFLTSPIKSAVYSLRDDRNGPYAHSTANESAYEIFEWGVIALGHISRFFEEVLACSEFKNEAGNRFKHEFRNRIQQAKTSLEVDYRSYLLNENDAREFDDLLMRVLSSKHQSLAFSEIACDFIKPSSPRYSPEKYFDWVLKAANAGVDSAQMTLGDWYYSGAALAGVEKDWREALKWYEKVDKKDPQIKVRTAALYAAGISNSHTIEEGQALIEQYKGQWNIECNESEDGLTEYYVVSKRNSVGRLSIRK